MSDENVWTGGYKEPVKGNVYTGPTLRDFFAMAALTGIMSARNGKVYYEDVARAAYSFADAMLEAREADDA